MSFTYKNNKTKEISFPLGGIGSGCIGLGGDGRLKDWEIFNKPNKGSVNGFSHFAIKAEKEHTLIDARVMHGDLAPPYTGELTGKPKGFGFGPRLESLAGVPHFLTTEFVGEYPLSTVRFIDNTFPGNVTLQAFNPFIPLDDKNSSLPAAFFEVTVKNPTPDNLTYYVALTVTNPMETNHAIHKCLHDSKQTIMHLGSNNPDSDDTAFGALAFGTDCSIEERIGYQQYWYRGQWFDSLNMFWKNFTSPGLLSNRVYSKESWTRRPDSATIERKIELKAGEMETLRFVISWYYPNCCNYWNSGTCDCNDSACCPSELKTWKNYYASLFKGAEEVCSYSLENWQNLKERTLKFKNALFSSTVPDEVLDAVSANISTLKSPTVLRLTDGSFYGFEGCSQNSGCCEGSCSHVWNYAYALPYLFPHLERSMRELEFRYNQREDGQLVFRLMLPLGSPKWDFRACVDGQFGAVIKVYRDWKICGNNDWIAGIWPAVKKALEFAWAPSNEDLWDPEQSGIISGRQHHTLDMELFGPNSWLNGFYLAGLKAAAEIADFLGDTKAADLYREIFKRGKEWTDRELFNGKYYHQKIDLKDKSVLDAFYTPHDVIHRGGNIYDAYWNDEQKELKFQIAEGCAIDQVLAQWHANLIGLGEIFDKDQTILSLRSIYDHNFVKSLRYFFNPCRTFALNDEAGAVICSWPSYTYKPYIPIPYAEEAMNGFEYQAACHMIQEGLVEEGLDIVRAVRERYDGEKRNPWNEFECGSNYARSMASYGLLLSYSGFSCDMSKHLLSFNPIFTEGKEFSSFWSVASGWGTVKISSSRVSLSVLEGFVQLSQMRLPFIAQKPYSSVITEKGTQHMLDFIWETGVILYSETVEIQESDNLIITYGK